MPSAVTETVAAFVDGGEEFTLEPGHANFVQTNFARDQTAEPIKLRRDSSKRENLSLPWIIGAHNGSLVLPAAAPRLCQEPMRWV